MTPLLFCSLNCVNYTGWCANKAEQLYPLEFPYIQSYEDTITFNNY